MICLLRGRTRLATTRLAVARLCLKVACGGTRRNDVRSVVTLTSLGQLDLNPVDPVDGVDEQNQDENEGDLEAVLELGNNGVLRDESDEGHIVN